MLQGQFGYGPEDLWVNGGVPFTSASATTTTHNNNAYFVGQVSVQLVGGSSALIEY